MMWMLAIIMVAMVVAQSAVLVQYVVGRRDELDTTVRLSINAGLALTAIVTVVACIGVAT